MKMFIFKHLAAVFFSLSLSQTSDFRGFDLSDRMTVCQNRLRSSACFCFFCADFKGRIYDSYIILNSKRCFLLRARPCSAFDCVTESEATVAIRRLTFLFSRHQSLILVLIETEARHSAGSALVAERSALLLAEIAIVMRFPGLTSTLKKNPKQISL